MTTAGLILLGALAVFLTRRWPEWHVFVVIAAYVIFPNQTANALTPFLTPGSFVLVGAAIATVALQRRAVIEVISRHWWMYAVMLVILAGMSLDIINPAGGGFLEIGLDGLRLVLIPLALMTYVAVAVRQERDVMRRLVPLLAVLGLAEVYLANLQVQSGGLSGYFWVEYYRDSYWWVDGFALGMGTTGHPLQLGLFLAALVPLLHYLRPAVLRLPLALVFAYGASLGTARVAFVLCVVGILFLLLAGARRYLATGIAILIAIPVGVAVARSTGFFALTSKFESDGGSAALRREALIWSWYHREEFMYFGYPGARDVRGAGLLGSSLENGYIMFGFTFGIVLGVVLLLAHVVIGGRPLLGSWRATGPAVLASLVTIVGFTGSSSFMALGLEGFTFWALVGMSYGILDRESGRSRRLVATPAAPEDTLTWRDLVRA